MPPKNEQQQFRLRFRDALDDMRAGDSSSWEVLLDQFESGRYLDQLEQNAEWILGELGERSFDAVKLIDQLMAAVGAKSGDLRGKLQNLKADILHRLAPPAASPEPPPESAPRKQQDKEEAHTPPKPIAAAFPVPGADPWTRTSRKK